MGVNFLEKQTKHPAAQRIPSSVHKSPVEGVLIVNGRPQMESLDMPCISFESILALQQFKEQHPDK